MSLVTATHLRLLKARSEASLPRAPQRVIAVILGNPREHSGTTYALAGWSATVASP